MLSVPLVSLLIMEKLHEIGKIVELFTLIKMQKIKTIKNRVFGVQTNIFFF